jgi:hydrogenase nickel incorporation protein HypA/HybF
MHEFGLCEGIVDAIQRRAAGRPVARVRVRIGVLHRVVTEAFQHAFAHAARCPFHKSCASTLWRG